MGKKIVIIGGGVAGLSAGIYAQINNFDAEIIEMHSITGGQCTAWDRKGYRFDYCLHWLVGTRNGPFNEIWKETGVLNEKVEIVDHTIHTKVYDSGGEEFIIYTNLDRWEEYLTNIAPEDKKKIRKMCNEMRKSAYLYPISNPPRLRKFRETLVTYFRMLPVIPLFLKYGKNSVDDYFLKLKLSNEKLNNFFNQLFGGRDFSALAFIMMFAWFNQKNAGYLIGGSLPMAQRMTDRFVSLGGKLTTRKRVAKILVVNDMAVGVELSDGTAIMADYVISAADGYSTIFGMLGGKYLNKKFSDAYNKWKLFTPIVQVSFGINKVIPSDSASELWCRKDTVIGKTLTKNGYAFMNYGFDKTMSPEGKSVIVIRFDSPWELWEDMNDIDYASEKEKIRKDALCLLEERYPGIKESVEVIDVATPLTDVRYTGVWKGAYEGFMPSSKNLMKNLNMTLPGLKKFYMAGQWLFPGGGLPPAGQSGKWAIQYIASDEGQIFKSKITGD